MEVLDLLVELGVLERQGHELGDRLGDGDLLVGELALDVVEQVDQPMTLSRAIRGSETQLRWP